MHVFHAMIHSIEVNQAGILMAVGLTAIFLLLLTLYLLASIISLKRRYAFLLRHEDTQDLGAVFTEYARRVDALEFDQKALNDQLIAARRTLEICVQKVGMVRYDAFEDVGGQQSYALALLDAKNNGTILSSVYSRNESRTYAKAVSGGRSNHNLST